MPVFILVCHDKPGALELRLATRAAHLAYVGEALATVKRAGALLDEGGSMVGSMFMIDAADKDAVHAFHAGDPYTLAGLFERHEILTWRQSLGAP